MAKNFFRRYIWLIDLIRRWGYITFPDISREWQRSPLNDTGEPLSERTFFNHKSAILDTFGIEIRNDRTLGFYIVGDGGEDGDSTAEWMLHALCLNNVLQENADMRGRIILENVPSGEKFLTDIISAMRNSRVISLTYRSFQRDYPTCFPVKPYCVKYFRQRWYMLADSDLGLRMYALDRFEDMEALDEKYEIPESFDSARYFDTCFGVIVGEEPVEVKLKVSPYQARYFRTLPLHHSQREEGMEGEWPVFSYRIAPSFDFMQEILSHGADVEVLSPQGFRKSVATVAGAMNRLYDKEQI